MKKRTFDEMVSYFNRKVADMEIDRKYKMELLGMITAILQEHDSTIKPEQRWIPVTEMLPEIDKEVLVTDEKICWICSLFESPDIEDGFHQWEDNYGHWHEFDAWIAWMPLPEPYKERREE